MQGRESALTTLGPDIQTRQITFMNSTDKKPPRKKKKKARTALVICRDRKQFWTTQPQFWQWIRDGVVEKTGDAPLTGIFRREHEELMVILGNTVLNLALKNHLHEALIARRLGLASK